jgi:cytochrome P450
MKSSEEKLGPQPRRGVRRRACGESFRSKAIAQRRANPADDLISALLAASDDAEVLSETELHALYAVRLEAKSRASHSESRPSW